MKKRLLTVAFLMGAWSAYSQVGIGTTTPNKSSQLEIVAKDKGLLIPQVPLKSSTDVTTITNKNVNSLLVWNTNTIADITPGYYYWFVDKWMRIVDTDTFASLDANTKNTSLTVQGDELVLTDSDGKTVSIPLAAINIPTTMVKNSDGTYTYTNEAGEAVVIDIPASVVENLETIVNNGPVTVNGDTFNTVEEYLTHVANASITIGGSEFVEVTGDGTTANPYKVSIIEGAKNSMLITNAAGDLEWATIESIVKGNETVTTIVANGDGTYTYTNEAGDTAVIDVPSSFVQNLETIINKGPVTVNGDTFNTVEEYLTHVANASITIGGSDFITVSGDGTAANPYEVSITPSDDPNAMLITNAAGELEWATIESIVKGNETVTTLVYNEDGTYTYKNEAGAEVTIDIPASIVDAFETIVNNGPVTVNGDTFNTVEEYLTHIANASITIGGSEFVEVTGTGTVTDPYKVSIIEGGNNSMLITNKDGDLEWATITSIIAANETITTLVDNGDGTFTYYNEADYDENGDLIAGTPGVTFDANTTSVTVTDGVYKFVDGAGNTITEIDTNADAIAFDNSTNGFASDNVQDALEELLGKLDATTDALVDLGNGNFEHTAVDGTKITFDINSVNVSENKDAAGNILGYDFKDASGAVITTVLTDASNNYYDDTKSGLGADNVQDALDNLANKLAEGAGVELKDEGDGKVTLVADNGDILGTVDKSKLTEDAVNEGLFTFTRNDGTDVVFDVNTVNVSENKDADGNVLGYDFKDAAGNVITTVLTDASNNYYDNSNSDLVADNVQDALDELADKLADKLALS